MNRYFRFLADFISDVFERRDLIKRFNESAKHAYYSGNSDRLLKAHTSNGKRLYKHSMSRLRSGFRISVMGIDVLKKPDATEMAMVILENGAFTRQLMAIGYDSLEIESGYTFYDWQMSKYQDLQKFALSNNN
jgi:hypothetical protein